MWGEDQFFPHMNRNFDLQYTSLWAWQPKKLGIWVDPAQRHGTILGTHESPGKILPPYGLLHRSWNPETIHQKMNKYNLIGLPMNHPFDFAGELKPLPDWAIDEAV
jgi:hypothetical protein